MGIRGAQSDDPGKMPLTERIVKLESGVVADVQSVVDLEVLEDVKPVVEKVRRAPSRSSSRIAILASRQPVKQEVQELSPSPQRVRKRMKVAAKTTVKQEKKVKVVKVKKEVVKDEKDGATDEVVDALALVAVGNDVDHQGEDDPGEVADEGNRAGAGKKAHQAHQAHTGLKLAQQLADRAGLNDAGQVKATIRIFNFVYLESVQVC